mgnify:CR=1 FL=1
MKLATRGSSLALVQAEAARSAFLAASPGLRVELLELRTAGDTLLDVSLEKVEGKGFFTGALEEALLDGRAEAAVHSLKDLPTELDPRFALAAVLRREDPRDALVLPAGSGLGGLDGLPAGAVIGTDSSRRRAQLAARRPDLGFRPLRGNVPTRLRKLDEGGYDALVLAVAGLRRLGLEARISQALEADLCLPAPGQGAIALETLAGGEGRRLAAALDDAESALATRAERAFLAALGGGCRTPVGALAEIEGSRLRLRGVAFMEGRAHRVELEGAPEAGEELGKHAAARLLEAGVRV